MYEWAFDDFQRQRSHREPPGGQSGVVRISSRCPLRSRTHVLGSRVTISGQMATGIFGPGRLDRWVKGRTRQPNCLPVIAIAVCILWMDKRLVVWRPYPMMEHEKPNQERSLLYPVSTIPVKPAGSSSDWKFIQALPSCAMGATPTLGSEYE